MEDVNGSKKDLSASAGESPTVDRLCTYCTYVRVRGTHRGARLRFNQTGMQKGLNSSLCNLSEPPLQTLGKTGTICVCTVNRRRFLPFIFVSCSPQIKILCYVALKKKRREEQQVGSKAF